MSQQQHLDARGEAHEALGTAVASYGQRVLSDPHILGNLVADLLPDLPRERSLLVAGAEAQVASEMTQYVRDQHVDPDTAVQLVARMLVERRAIDPAASIWVATEYAQALGYQVTASAPAGDPSVSPTLTALPVQPGATRPPSAAPVSPQVPPMPYQGQSWPPQGGPPQGGLPPGGAPQGWAPPPQPGEPPHAWPPQPLQPPQAQSQPPGGRRPTGNSRTRTLVAIGAALGIVVAYLVVAAVVHVAPFAKAHAASHTPRPRPAPRTQTPTPPPSLAGGVTALAALMPGDINDPSTQCKPEKKPYDWKMPGLVSALDCGDQTLPGGSVDGYQMDSSADYQTAWRNFNTWWGFDSSSAAQSCPPPGGSGQGSNGWHSNFFPQLQGQVLECEITNGGAPVYVWTMPTQDAFIIAVAADGTSFSTLEKWWENAEPAKSPSPVAS